MIKQILPATLEPDEKIRLIYDISCKLKDSLNKVASHSVYNGTDCMRI